MMMEMQVEGLSAATSSASQARPSARAGHGHDEDRGTGLTSPSPSTPNPDNSNTTTTTATTTTIPTLPTTATIVLPRSRSKSTDRSLLKRTPSSTKRYSLQEPAVPKIPAHFLSLSLLPAASTAPRPRPSPPLPPSRHESRALEAAGIPNKPQSREPSDHEFHAKLTRIPTSVASSPLLAPPSTTSTTRAPPTSMAFPDGSMSRFHHSRNDGDLFLDLAHERSSIPPTDPAFTHLRRPMSRTSHTNKRRSIHAELATADLRPATSGQTYSRPASRVSTFHDSTDSRLQRYTNHYPSSSSHRASYHFDDTASTSGRSQFGRTARRFSMLPDRSPLSPSARYAERESVQSPILSHYGSRRTSFGTAPSEPANSENQLQPTETQGGDNPSPIESDPQRTDSSVESQPADTVWDELDDLKTRIRKLEGGKVLTTSSAEVSGNSSERPRTATTAPTTIDFSPRQTRAKQEIKPQEDSPTPTPLVEHVTSSSQQLLQDSLVRAKETLNPVLYRSLEATISDTMQLSALFSNAGTQSNSFVGALTPTGATAIDRQVRRRVDNMCRNLTDLCIALCETKAETAKDVTSPTATGFPASRLPTLRPARSVSLNIGSNYAQRPLSRLESRRSSLLGSLPRSERGATSPRTSAPEISGSDADSTPTHSNTVTQSSTLQIPPHRLSGAPSRSLRSRLNHEDISGDEGPPPRPLSRAMTDIGSMRGQSRLSLQPDRATDSQQRHVSLREALAAKRNNDTNFEGNRELARSGSIGRRRRFAFENTPPVMEEDDSPSHFQQRHGVFSTIQQRLSSARSEIPSRNSSLNHRRELLVE